ncbi:Uncharacterised protein [Actinobacillus pleuropneumoniae]|nr:Uncharacterised protein [Actinobacillus pleuropneumoniae]
MKGTRKLEPYEEEFLKLLAKGIRIMAEKREQEMIEASDLDKKNNLKEHLEGNITQNPKRILSRAELPNYLTPRNIHQFTNINLRSVYDLMNKSLDHGGIPAFRIGKSLYSDREEFLKWWDETKERGRK